MKYENVIKGKFIKRPNRFIAEVLVDGSAEKAHVKNTGRLKELLYEVGCDIMGADKMVFNDGWAMGCSDIGDVSCVMPTIQPAIAGSKGSAHSQEFAITDPVTACVTSAKIQCAMVVRLLENDAEQGKRVLAENKREFPTIKEYLASADQLCIDKQAVTKNEDGTLTLSF